MDRNEILIDFNKKVKPYFKGLTFKASSHEYFVGDKKVPKSVSALIKIFVQKVDFDKIAAATDKRDGLALGTTKKAWDEKARIACEDGSDTHDFAEKEKKEEEANTEKKKAVMYFWADLNKQFPNRYLIVGRELMMYHKKHFFSGTADFILFDTWTGEYIIGDYKTNADLFKNHQGKMLETPFEYLMDCPYSHYQIQLSFYQVLLQQVEGIKISSRWIVWLHVNEQGKGAYKKYEMTDVSKDLDNWLDNNKVAT